MKIKLVAVRGFREYGTMEADFDALPLKGDFVRVAEGSSESLYEVVRVLHAAERAEVFGTNVHVSLAHGKWQGWTQQNDSYMLTLVMENSNMQPLHFDVYEGPEGFYIPDKRDRFDSPFPNVDAVISALLAFGLRYYTGYTVEKKSTSAINARGHFDSKYPENVIRRQKYE